LVQFGSDISVFDLCTLFDVVEHVDDPQKSLKNIAAHSRYVIKEANRNFWGMAQI
jgi:2-polyprenyl-3-methyl-5-hydroxy-6-metoxy-1,4-benzoquinol methylase